jgi:hypothetical protein
VPAHVRAAASPGGQRAHLSSAYVAGLHQPPMSLSVASAQSASNATTPPTATAFNVAVGRGLARVQGLMRMQSPSTRFTHSSHAVTLKSASTAIAATNGPSATALHIRLVAAWYFRTQGEPSNHSRARGSPDPASTD